MSGLNIKLATYVVGTYYVQTKLQRDFHKSHVYLSRGKTDKLDF